LKLGERIPEEFTRALLKIKLRKAWVRELDREARKQKLSELIFEFETAVKRSWQVFHLRTRDIGTDYMIAKDWAKLQIQLRSSWIRTSDGRYNFQLSRFEKDPTAFFIYLLIHFLADSKLDIIIREWPTSKCDFYIIPTTEMGDIKPFKNAFKSKTWKKRGSYNSTLTAEQIRQFLEKYKNEKGWERLKEHTRKP
jgi:hypothetical protein